MVNSTANNQTKGQQAGSSHGGGFKLLNPQFDRRMRVIGDPNVTPLGIKRGWMQTGSGQALAGHGNCRINFLYNPSTVQLSHAVSITQPNPQQVKTNDNRVSGDQAWYASTGSTIAFSLLFDRTYDVWTVPHTPTVASTFGCYADVASFYYFYGMIDEFPSAATLGPSHAGGHEGLPPQQIITEAWKTMSPKSPPHYIGADIYIGDKLFYYATCDSFNVTYTHWTTKMVPIRCAIDVSFTIQVPPGDVQKLVNNSGSGTSNGNNGSGGSGKGNTFNNPSGGSQTGPGGFK